MIEDIWRAITDPKYVFLIAEVGVNHNGCVETAKEMIEVASQAGADAVKFQTFRADRVVSANAEKAEYQKKSTAKNESLYEMLKSLELDFAQHQELNAFAKEKGILFLSTPFDNESADLIEKLDIPLFKISSGDITNLPLLKHISGKNKPMILSTGRSTLEEIEEAISTVRTYGSGQMALLHCVSNYPPSFGDLNLNAIQTLRDAYRLPVGFSDHTLGIEAAVAAVALGAVIIEKHFTLDRSCSGPDHKASLEPNELKDMIRAIKNIEKALGDGRKKPVPSELWGLKNVRKGIVSRIDISKGTVISEDMITIKRPAHGIEPKYLDDVIGRTVLRDIKKDSSIHWEEIDGDK